jgi:hypothetical protein
MPRLEEKSKVVKFKKGPKAKLINFAKAVENLIFERRKTERTPLQDLESAYIYAPDNTLRKVSVQDFSQMGLAFFLACEDFPLAVGSELELRIYLNRETYFPVKIKVSNLNLTNLTARELKQKSFGRVYRFGCTVDDESLNREAIEHFISFFKTINKISCKDLGDKMIS